MAIAAAAEFVAALAQLPILEPVQLDELNGLQVQFATAQALAGELVSRGWLSRFQAEQVLERKTVVLGSYLLLDKIGEGGMGAVFKARNWKLGKTVALKLIRKERLDSDDAVRRFHREIRAAAQLNHPNIVHAYDADEVGGMHILVMEHIDGIDLAKLVKQSGPLTIPQACDCIRLAALGLQHAHEHGLVHRDIKPHNLLAVVSGQLSVASGTGHSTQQLTTDNWQLATVKILDMGLARMVHAPDSSMTGTTMTKEGSVLGTPDYMAPEQAMEAHDVDIRADLYSLGCTFYFLLTGRTPFAAKINMTEKLVAHQFDEAPPVEALRPEVPPGIAAIVRKLLAKKPEDRYQTPAELAATLVDTATRRHADTATTSVSQAGRPAASSTDLGNLSASGSAVELERQRRRQEEDRLLRQHIKVGGGILLGLIVLVAGLVWWQNSERGQPAKKEDVSHESPLTPRRRKVDDAWIKSVARLKPEAQVKAVADKLKDLNPAFDAKVTHLVDNGVVTSLQFFSNNVTDISPLAALPGLKTLEIRPAGDIKSKLFDLSPLKGMKLMHLDCTGTSVADLSPLQGMPLEIFRCFGAEVTDLAPLAGMPLVELNVTGPFSDLTPLKGMKLKSLGCNHSKLSDLSPLKGMPLTGLQCYGTQVADLSPLQGMPLTYLACHGTPISDLSPLKGMPLSSLHCYATQVSDLSPLKDMPLKDLACDFRPFRDMATLKSITTLETINRKPAAQFWNEVDAEQARFDAWVKDVRKLPPDKQVEAVAEELKKRNPGFDGKVTHRVEDGVVTDLAFSTDSVTDIAPVRALLALRHLECTGTERKGKLSDLSPLKGMPLKQLSCYGNKISDLSPLRGMPLTSLHCGSTPIADLLPLQEVPLVSLICSGSNVTDLSPLRGMQLTFFNCDTTRVKDLSPLKGMPLRSVGCHATEVSDLTPLKGMPLNSLNCTHSPVTDLSPLKGMSLTVFSCEGARVTDLLPLEGMPLKVVSCDFNPYRDAELLRSIKTLEKINNQPVTDFWQPYDAFDAWVESVRKLPADKQVEAVAEELKKRNPGFDWNRKPAIEDGKVSAVTLVSDLVSDISPLRAFADLKGLRCAGSSGNVGKVHDLWPLRGLRLANLEVQGNGKLHDLTPLRGMPLGHINLQYTAVADLTPLRGMPLKVLYFSDTDVSDLSPLRGMQLSMLALDNAKKISDVAPLANMPLQRLAIAGTMVSDLSPLAGMPLQELNCLETAVADLSPLKAMKLKVLWCARTRVRDHSPIAGLPLVNLWCDFNPWRDADILRSLKTLEEINRVPAAEFWKPHDAFDAWVESVRKLPAEQQVEAVSEELKKRNPGWDAQNSKVEPKIENGAVDLTIGSDKLIDIAPVRALPALRSLDVNSNSLANLWPLKALHMKRVSFYRCPIVDLTPLKGMPLEEFAYQVSHLAPDLAPLQGMRLRRFGCYASGIADLVPLAGMPIIEMAIHASQVRDLTPLKGMPLQRFACSKTKIADLKPLKGMPLTLLDCSDTEVADLSPLRGMPLEWLQCTGTRVTDLSPLKTMTALNRIDCDFNPWRDTEILKSIKTLNGINGKTAAEFWKPYDAFDAWVKDVRKLPADKQVVAVIEELKKRNPGLDLKLVDKWEGGPDISLEFESKKTVILQLVPDKLVDVGPLRAFTGLRGLNIKSQSLADLWPLRGLILKDIVLQWIRASDLTPLRGMPLESFRLGVTPLIRDLSPLKGMKLHHLHCVSTGIDDLSPVAGMPVHGVLNLDGSPVRDLSPLKGMRITVLTCGNTNVSDLSPLRELPLETLGCDFNPWRDTEVLKSIKTLQKINDKPVAEFWKEVDAQQAAFDAWAKQVVALKPEEQVKAVAEELKKRNPGFDGKVAHEIKEGVVTHFDLRTDNVTDIAPVRALTGLKHLGADAARVGGKLSDLWPLSGMPLKAIGLVNTSVADLTPLRGMPLQSLYCSGGKLLDSAPLRGMPLETLHYFDFQPERDTALLKSIKTLKSINGKPAAEFWKEVDAKAKEKPP